jgi:hypothetical protein
MDQSSRRVAVAPKTMLQSIDFDATANSFDAIGIR